jgi:hypothetical protein
MNISNVKTAIRVGKIIENPNIYQGDKYVLYQNSLKLIYDLNFPKELKSKQVSLIYFFVVDGKIVKIGQSSCVDGIKGCMNFYMIAGQDDPGLNRFAINYLIRKSLQRGGNVELYMKYQEPIKTKIQGMFGSKIMEVPVSAKGMEDLALTEYLNIEKKYPLWNYQESKVGIPSKIQTIFGKYKIDRKLKSNI